MRILIVDDHPLYREGLKTFLAKHDAFTIIGEAGTGERGIELALEHRPDLVLVDLSMPDMDGIDIIDELSKRLPDTRYLVLSRHSKPDHVANAFLAGASGYIIKESATSQLLEGLQTLDRGELFVDTMLSRDMVFRMVDKLKNSASTADPYKVLTPREREVMRLLAEGLNTKEVAQKLFISAKTVENHRAKLMKKLGLANMVDLLKHAAQNNLIDLSSWADNK